jgi:magnesium transporter
MDERVIGPIIQEMSADQQADLLREMPARERTRFLEVLDPATSKSLEQLLKYAPKTAAGIMTTEFVSVPTMWTVTETLEHIANVGRAKETIYAVYVVDPEQKALVHVVSLRDLLLADRSARVLDVSDDRMPLTVRADTSREDVGRLISKYNLLAVPVVDDRNRSSASSPSTM